LGRKEINCWRSFFVISYQRNAFLSLVGTVTRFVTERPGKQCFIPRLLVFFLLSIESFFSMLFQPIQAPGLRFTSVIIFHSR
jgi:hypothetical protein